MANDLFVPMKNALLLSLAEHSNKDKGKERDREEREKKKFKEREREEKKKKHKAVNEIKRENGEVKQPIKGWWERIQNEHIFFLTCFLDLTSISAENHHRYCGQFVLCDTLCVYF